MIRLKMITVCFWMLLVTPVTHAFDLNRASIFELESMREIGEKTAKAIVYERDAHGPFKNWDDFKDRIKGIGERKLKKMQDNGLTLSSTNAQASMN